MRSSVSEGDGPGEGEVLIEIMIHVRQADLGLEMVALSAIEVVNT